MKRGFTLPELVVLVLIVTILGLLATTMFKDPAPTPDEVRQKIVEEHGEQWAEIQTGDLLRNTALPDRPIYFFFQFSGDEVEVFHLNPRTLAVRVILPVQSRGHQWEIIPRGDGELPSEEWVRALDNHLQRLRTLVAESESGDE